MLFSKKNLVPLGLKVKLLLPLDLKLKIHVSIILMYLLHGHFATNRKVEGSIPDGVIGIFH
jgi:hypothetical protein